MKKLLLFSLVLVWAIAVPASPAMDPFVRLHFIGAERILSDTNSAAFTNFFCSAEAQAVRAQTLDKLSRALVRWGNGPEFAGAGAESLRPLLEDLFRAEWFLDVRSGPEGSLAFALALRLEAGRAAVWQDALAAVMEAQTKITPQKIPGGWQWKRSPASNPLRFVREGDGCVFSCEPDDGVLSKGAAAGRPWLSTLAMACTACNTAPSEPLTWLTSTGPKASANRWMSASVKCCSRNTSRWC